MHNRSEEESTRRVVQVEMGFGVIFDRRVAARVKGKVKPVVMYGLETVALRKRQEGELKMLRF